MYYDHEHNNCCEVTHIIEMYSLQDETSLYLDNEVQPIKSAFSFSTMWSK